MTLATILVVTLAVVVVAASRRSGQGWLAPANLYAVVWAVAVALYELRLFPFYDLELQTWALLGAGGTAFLATAIWGGWRSGSAGAASSTPPAPAPDPFPLIRLFLVVGLCGFAIFLWRIDNYSGLLTFFHSPQPTYHALTLRKINTAHLFLYYFGIAGAILFGYAIFLLDKRPRAVDVVLLALFVAAMAISMERTHFLWVVASWSFLRLAPVRGNRTLLHVVLTVVVAMAVAAPFYLAVGRWLGKTPSTYSYFMQTVADKARTAPWEIPAPGGGRVRGRMAKGTMPASSNLRLILPGGPLHRLSVFYLSVGAPLPTFNDVVLNPEPLRYGRMTLHPLVRLAERLRLIPGAEALSIYPDVPTPYPANAYTYLYEFYLDFGWAGVIFLPALLGWISGTAYARTREASGLSAWPLVLCQLQGMILWTPFANRFVTTVNVYTVVLLVVGIMIAPRLARRS